MNMKESFRMVVALFMILLMFVITACTNEENSTDGTSK